MTNKNSWRYLKHHQFVTLFFSLWLLIDSASGYLLNSGYSLPVGNSIGSILKLIFVIFSFVFLIVRVPTRNNLPIFLLLFVFLSVTIHAFLGSNDNPIFDLQGNIKLVSPILFYYLLKNLIKHGLDSTQVQKIISLNAIVLFLNFLVGYLGMGFRSYGAGTVEEPTSSGVVGFFYAANEIAAVILAIYALILILCKIEKKNTLYTCSMVMLFLFIAVLTFTKTAVIGVVVLTIIYAIINARLKYFYILPFFAIVIFLTNDAWSPYIMDGSIRRWQFIYNRSESILVFLTSGRIDRIHNFTNSITSSTLLFFTGVGWDLKGNTSYENDFLDIIAANGFLGVIFYILWIRWFLSMFICGRKINNDDGVSFFASITIGLLLVNSVIAGHTLTSSTLSPFLSLLLLLGLHKKSLSFPLKYRGC